MRVRPLPGTSLNVSEVCLGTMTFGEQNSEADAHAQLDYAFEHGVNFIDTADVYSRWKAGNNGGESETIIGNWIRAAAIAMRW